MASKLLNQDQHRANKIVESVGVRVSGNSSASIRNPRYCCKQLSNRSSAQLLMQNHSNFKRSGVPSRFMFFQDGCWVDFPSKVLETLRSAFMEGKPVIDSQIEGSTYLFDFLRMLQIDFETGLQRSIAWIDQNSKCFFPRLFIDEESENGTENSMNQKITIEIQIAGDLAKRKSQDEELDAEEEEEIEVNSVNRHGNGDVSKRQRMTASVLESPRWPSTKQVREGDRAYHVIFNFFQSAMTKNDPGATITAIHRFTRTEPLEKARYEVFQKQNHITKAARGTSNLVYAWYGSSSAKAVGDILSHGFSEPSRTTGSNSHGIGVYLSPVQFPQLSALISEADDNGEKHIILCRVILGNVEKVEAGSQQSHPSNVDFDTGVDDPKNPRWYVIWCSSMNRHILPEYVLSYRPSNNVQGQFKGSTFTTKGCSLVKLLSKMKDSLPSSKIHEVACLFKRYRAGDLAKEAMVKQLRSIAGDEILLSSIREIRGCDSRERLF